MIHRNYHSTIASDFNNDSFHTFLKNCLKSISRILVETLTFSPKVSTRIEYKGISELEARCVQGNGLLLLASHYGNWELACIHLPLHTDIPIYGVYKPLKDKALDKIILELRSKHGLNLVPMNNIVRVIAENVSNKIPAIYILIADQNPRSIQNVVWADFLGKKTAFSKGFLRFRKKYDFPIAYMKNTPSDNLFEYKISFTFPPLEKETDHVTWYSEQVESQIKEAPHHWLWSHNRWKRKYRPTELDKD